MSKVRIKYNKELEDKERLFNDKVSELKNLFDKQNLQSLHSLKFELLPHNLRLDDEEDEADTNRNGKTSRVVEE